MTLYKNNIDDYLLKSIFNEKNNTLKMIIVHKKSCIEYETKPDLELFNFNNSCDVKSNLKHILNYIKILDNKSNYTSDICDTLERPSKIRKNNSNQFNITDMEKKVIFIHDEPGEMIMILKNINLINNNPHYTIYLHEIGIKNIFNPEIDKLKEKYKRSKKRNILLNKKIEKTESIWKDFVNDDILDMLSNISNKIENSGKCSLKKILSKDIDNLYEFIQNFMDDTSDNDSSDSDSSDSDSSYNDSSNNNSSNNDSSNNDTSDNDSSYNDSSDNDTYDDK
jgi:hypothetical protein